MKTGMTVLFILTLAAAPLSVNAGNDWSVDWYSIDGGGTLQASGGNWSLAGTIGQADATPANALSGGSFQLTGGFWSLIAEFADQIFSDRFESNLLMQLEDDNETRD